jgi:hypothetical protein
VAAGALVPVTVTLVPIESIEKARTVYAELFGGVTLPPLVGVSGIDDCRGGCVMNAGGLRGGYLLAPRLGLELFLIPFLETTRASEHPLTAKFGDGSASTDRYRTSADLAGTFGGASLAYRFFETWPVIVRLWAGAGRVGISTSGGAVFYDAPAGHAPFQQVYPQSAAFWTPVFGPEVRVGFRLSRGLVMDLGAAALAMRVSSLQRFPGISYFDTSVVLPQGPGFDGGWAVVFPVTLSLRMDFGS